MRWALVPITAWRRPGNKSSSKTYNDQIHGRILCHSAWMSQHAKAVSTLVPRSRVPHMCDTKNQTKRRATLLRIPPVRLPGAGRHRDQYWRVINWGLSEGGFIWFVWEFWIKFLYFLKEDEIDSTTRNVVHNSGPSCPTQYNYIIPLFVTYV